MPKNGTKPRPGRPVVGPYDKPIKVMVTLGDHARLYRHAEARRRAGDRTATVSEIIRRAIQGYFRAEGVK